MPTPNVTIGGIQVLANEPVNWTLRSGVRPVIHTFSIAAGDADAARRLSPGPVELVIQIDGQETLTVRRLFILNVAPGDNPNLARVTVADRRCWWPYSHVLRRYNVRRHVGVNRSTAIDTPQVNQTFPAFAYAKWSLKVEAGSPAGKWRAKDMLDDIIEEATRAEIQRFGGNKNLLVSSDVKDDMPIEDLIIDEPGDTSVARALKYLPEAELYIDAHGNINVYSRVSGAERDVVEALKPEIVGRGHTDLVQNRALRPIVIYVGFTREVELRMDFLEAASKTSTVAEIGESRLIENVMPLPDYQLAISGALTAQGTWVTINEALNNWENPPGLGRLDHDLIRRAFVPFMDLWTSIELNGIKDPRADWSARVAALQQHYRRTFRINSRWTDRALSFRPYRVSILDRASGQRAPAMAWADYAVIPSMRCLWAQATAREDFSYVVNVDGFPGGDLGLNSKPAPCSVEVLDSDQGIIHLEYKIDPYRSFEMVLPSQVEINGRTGVPGPCGNLRDRTRPLTFDSVVSATGWPQLTASHKVAVILTAVPAAPNKKQQLHWVKVRPQDVARMLPASQTLGLSDAVGPAMEVRIGPGLEVARVQWLDSRASDIEAMFGIGQDARDIEAAVRFSARVKDITLNSGPPGADAAKGASLEDIANAVAARIYAALADRVQGSMSGQIRPHTEPVGWISEVSHEVNTPGDATTSVNLPDQIPQFSILSFLDSSTRSIILKQVQP